jgi:hypothetical protein
MILVGISGAGEEEFGLKLGGQISQDAQRCVVARLFSSCSTGASQHEKLKQLSRISTAVVL